MAMTQAGQKWGLNESWPSLHNKSYTQRLTVYSPVPLTQAGEARGTVVRTTVWTPIPQ
jgi:hypothetical protein